jgi:hypothetical protein
MVSTFRAIHFQHIYRETNMEADRLSKKAMLVVSGRLFYYAWDGEAVGIIQCFDIF